MDDRQLLYALQNMEFNPKGDTWERNCDSVRREITEKTLKDFLRLPTIRQTMFVGNCDYIDTEYNRLQASIKWPRWKFALQESGIGNPQPYTYNINTSGNAIHTTHHIMTLEETFNADISTLDYIYEFGGGYGCMARSCYQAGFKGKYILHDLKLFLKLQQWFLEKHDIHAEYIENHEALSVTNNSLFIATWSVSETPREIREQQINMWQGFKYILIGYQSVFDDINNHEYFQDKIKDMEQFSWQVVDIPHITHGTHRYLLGYNYHV